MWEGGLCPFFPFFFCPEIGARLCAPPGGVGSVILALFWHFYVVRYVKHGGEFEDEGRLLRERLARFTR